MATEFVAATVPAKTVFASDTTLFHIAQEQLGDALRWPEIATLNGMTDPWIVGMTQILIPPVVSTAPVTGILGL